MNKRIRSIQMLSHIWCLIYLTLHCPSVGTAAGGIPLIMKCLLLISIPPESILNANLECQSIDNGIWNSENVFIVNHKTVARTIQRHIFRHSSSHTSHSGVKLITNVHTVNSMTSITTCQSPCRWVTWPIIDFIVILRTYRSIESEPRINIDIFTYTVECYLPEVCVFTSSTEMHYLAGILKASTVNHSYVCV